MCALERFYERQQRVGSCGGILIGKKHIATVAHCVSGYEDCSSFKWVFDYHMASQGDDRSNVIDKRNVFSCKRVVERINEDAYIDTTTRDRNDYAIVELDREVPGRKIFPIDQSEKTSNDAQLITVGYPSGLPSRSPP